MDNKYGVIHHDGCCIKLGEVADVPSCVDIYDLLLDCCTVPALRFFIILINSYRYGGSKPSV